MLQPTRETERGRAHGRLQLAQLSRDVLAMAFDRAHGNVELDGNFLVTQVTRAEPSDLQLSLGEDLAWRRAERRPNANLEARGHALNRCQQHRGRRALDDITARASAPRTVHVGRPLVHAEHDDAKLRMTQGELFSQADAVSVAEADVDEHDGRRGTLGHLQRLLGIAGLTYN